MKVQKDDSCIRDGDGEGNIEDLKKGKVPYEGCWIIINGLSKEDIILQGWWGQEDGFLVIFIWFQIIFSHHHDVDLILVSEPETDIHGGCPTPAEDAKELIT